MDVVAADVILVGCVQTKRADACAAAELFASPLFEGRHKYAAASGLRWYILSAKFGLLAPGVVIGPYDVYLADQSSGYRKAWGEFVIAALEQREGDLRRRTIEIHVGAAYVDPLRAPAAARGGNADRPAGSPAPGRAARLVRLLTAGLYSWWVEEPGAADLSRGLGQPVAAGLPRNEGSSRWYRVMAQSMPVR